MNYSEAKYGVSKKGVIDLLDQIKGELITKVATQCRDIEEIRKVCEENWHGTSCENFLTNLDEDTEKVEESLNALYTALSVEVNAAASAIFDFDQNLIEG